MASAVLPTLLLLTLLAGASLPGCTGSGPGVAETENLEKPAEDVSPGAVKPVASATGRRGDRNKHRDIEKQSGDELGALASSTGAGAEDELFSAVERMERKAAAAMTRVRESVVALEYTAADSPVGARRVATGVVISPQGEVLSIRIDRPPSRVPSGTGKTAQGKESGRSDSAPIIARDAAGRRHLATWVAADPETGLTLLRIPPKMVRPVRIASAPPKLGSSVFVVGNPFGLGHSVSRGHVAGLDRALELGPRQLGGLTQVQVPLYPGDSGATVANLRGEWLGLIRGGLAPVSASAGSPGGGGTRSREDDPDRDGDRDHDRDIGFAIPARDAIWVADQLRSSGRVDRAYLGVRLELTDGTEIGPNAEGAWLSAILADSPAAAAGLQAGDRIVGLDRHPIRSASDLTDRLDRIRAQTQVTLSVIRPRASAVAASKGPDQENGNTAKAQDRQDASNADAAADRIEVTLRAASRPALVSSSSSTPPSSEPTPIVSQNQETLSAIRRADADADADVNARPNAGTGSGAVPVSGVAGRAVISKTSSTHPVAIAVADPDPGVVDPTPAGDPAPKARSASAVPVSVSVPVAESPAVVETSGAGAVPLRPATVSVATSPSSSPPTSPAERDRPPAQRPLPLESQAVAPRPAELESISPRAVIERLERLERRLDRLERREQAAPATSASSSSRTTTDKTRD